MARSFDYFNLFQSDRAHLSCEEFGRAVNIGPMLRQSADTRNAQEVFEFGEESRLILACVIESRRGHQEEYTEAPAVAGGRRWATKPNAGAQATRHQDDSQLRRGQPQTARLPTPTAGGSVIFSL